jgi:uncharacterized protein (TIGR02246 family)
MPLWYVFVCILCLVFPSLAQQPTTPKPDARGEQARVAGDSALKDMFEANIKAEWEALKSKDKKAYAELLADDYEGVEVDGKGERTKMQSVSELAAENVYNYTLWGFKVIPLNPNAALVIYESTMQFPPKTQVRYSRVYISELWMKRDGQWKEVHYQETHVK